MANLFESKKWKRRTLTALSAALAASLTFGVLAACTKAPVEETEETPVAPTDTQVLKNGNFEFYSDNNLTETIKKYGVINSPNNWTFTSGSPSSDAASGIIDTSEWDYYTRTGGYSFKTFDKGEGDSIEEVTTFQTIGEAYAHWEDDNVSAYDRIKFLDIFETEINALDKDSEEKKLFDKYDYKVDYDDIKDLAGDFESGIALHAGVKEDETSVLMIHNSRLSDGVRGTAQYYTSGTTVTLAAGTSAKLSLFVRTDKLKHYEDTDLTARGGAYIGVTNTVGGTTLEQMQIFNINTRGEWREYTLYIRASTFATSTFRIVLGLGQGSSDDRYYAVDGYAFFDDLTCEIISNAQYEDAVLDSGAPKSGVRVCSVDSVRAEKRFDSDEVTERTFALDLYAGFTENDLLGETEIGLTEEKSGSKVYTSENIDPALGNDEELNYVSVTTLGELASSDRTYVKNVYEQDFKEKFPFENDRLVMLLSGNGAAYTATLHSELFTLAPDTRLLISFFVKTNKVLSGLTGASAAVVDGDTRTEINAFDTTNIAGVDIDAKSDDPDKKDIYRGWVQCFFFLENDTEDDKTFTIELCYGPREITSTTKFSYGDGYAAFANFETKLLTKTEYSYASTGDRAKKASLTGGTEGNKRFDTVSVTDEKGLESRPALPANFRGVLGGSDFVQKNETSVPNVKPVTVTSGLVNSKYAQNYFESEESWRRDALAGTAETADEWWQEIFGNARQPLLIVNGEDNVTYGYFAESATISSSSYQRVSMRVKASEGAKAFIYLTETAADSTGKSISPNLPAYTYWYDDEGNICRIDPNDEDFDDKTDILFELQPNGLYKRVNGDNTYYANLSAFEEDDDGNKVTKAGEIVFYHLGGVYYAYRTENKNGDYEYSTPVQNLPAENLRYDYSDRDALPVTEMEITGTGEWETVSFYIHTGSEGKSYRLEVWNGSRDGKVTNRKNSYVLFDNYASVSASSNYSDLLDEAVSSVKELLNEGKDITDSDYIGEDDPLPKHDLACYEALYYTFTFFDSSSYVRYDETLDEEALGNPWGSFKQSEYEEQLVSLYFAQPRNGGGTNYSFFLDYAAIDVTVTPDDLSQDEAETETPETTTAQPGNMNIWLLISSGILAVVLLAVIVIVVVRRIFENKSKKTRIKPAPDKRIKGKRIEE